MTDGTAAPNTAPSAADDSFANPRFFAQGGHILLGGSDAGIEYIDLKLANRHGDITGVGRGVFCGRRPGICRRH